MKGCEGHVGLSITVSDITKHKEELERLIRQTLPFISTDDTIEPATFALEQHLENFFIQNWQHTELGRSYDIFTEDGEVAGRQYSTDTGYIDILAISKDRQTLLVVELKKGRTTDAVAGQVLRYMGDVKEELAEPGQSVKGAIIALDNDLGTQRALSTVSNIAFYQYHIHFSLTET